MTKWGFDRALQIGDIGQEIVLRDLVHDKWVAVEQHKIPPEDGHGPRLATDGRGVTLPDLRATKHGYTAGLEVKAKTELPFGLFSGEPEHGIDQSCYDDMRDYERRTGEPVLIVVVELFWIVSVPEPDGETRMCETSRLSWLKQCLLADNESDADESLEYLRAEVHGVGRTLIAPVSDLRPRLGRDRQNRPMVYFPCSQLRTDWLDSMNRRVLRKRSK